MRCLVCVLFLNKFVCKDDDFLAFKANENLKFCTMMYRMATPNGIDFAKDHPKFLSLFSMETTSNQSVVDEDGNGDVVEKKCKEGLGSVAKCPMGMKRTKQMKKEDEMVDRLSQKFGITSNKTKMM